MADTGALSPGTMADDDTVGTVTWTDPDNAKVSDNSRVLAIFGVYSSGVEVKDTEVKIVKSDGTIGTINKADTTNSWVQNTDTYKSYGSSSDLWGETWTYSDINDIDFGVVISCRETFSSKITHYLKATNFGFSIPTESTVNGILVEIEKHFEKYGPVVNNTYALVDHIRITVYYTETSGDVLTVNYEGGAPTGVVVTQI